MVRAAAHSEVVIIVGLGLSLSSGVCLASLSMQAEREARCGNHF